MCRPQLGDLGLELSFSRRNASTSSWWIASRPQIVIGKGAKIAIGNGPSATKNAVPRAAWDAHVLDRGHHGATEQIGDRRPGEDAAG
jgi:hypothetical protein